MKDVLRKRWNAAGSVALFALGVPGYMGSAKTWLAWLAWIPRDYALLIMGAAGFWFLAWIGFSLAVAVRRRRDSMRSARERRIAEELYGVQKEEYAKNVLRGHARRGTFATSKRRTESSADRVKREMEDAFRDLTQDDE